MEFLSKIRSLVLVIAFFVASVVPLSVFGQCNQNNILIEGFQLRDLSGDEFEITDNYEIGDSISGGLWVYFGGSSKNAYNMNFYFDILINDVLRFNDTNGDGVYDQNYQCLFPGSIGIIKDQWIKVQNISWIWGNKVEITNVYAYWDTNGNASSCTIDSSPPNAQCYGSTLVYTAAVPLFPEFDFQASPICNSRLQFTNNTIGGTQNYSYAWNFDGDLEIESTEPEPEYDFPGSGTYSVTLTVSDGLTNRAITKVIVIDPNFGIQVTIVPTRSGESNGNITVTEVTGGTPDYSFYWTGENFTSTDRDIYNLSEGFYTLTVTDANGCTQTVEYYLDPASILNLQWKELAVKESGSKIGIEWVVNSEVSGGNYVVERSFKDVDSFKKLGEVISKGAFQSPTNYKFTDDTYPVFEDFIYYRIAYCMDGLISYSPVKLVQRNPEKMGQTQWKVYPNPSSDGKIRLKFTGGELPPGEKVQIQAINGSSYLKNLEVLPGKDNELLLDQFLGPIPLGITILRVHWNNQSELFKLIRTE